MSNYSVLKDLEDFLTYQNVENLKKKFNSEFIDNFHDIIVQENQEIGEFTIKRIQVFDDLFPEHKQIFESHSTIKFESYLAQILSDKIQQVKVDLDAIFIEIEFSQNKKTAFVEYLSITFKFIKDSQTKLFAEYPVCLKAIELIKIYLLEKYNIRLEFKDKNKNKVSTQIFANFPVPKIKKLYHLLTERPAFIEADEEEFISVFSGNEPKTGIKWLIKNDKNKKDISKPSLFYLIEQLVEKGYISNNHDSSFLRNISFSLFRDEEGNRFASGSLSTAITDYSKGQKKTPPSTPTRKANIDKIISELLK